MKNVNLAFVLLLFAIGILIGCTLGITLFPRFGAPAQEKIAPREPPPAPPQDVLKLQGTFRQIAQYCVPSVVHISATHRYIYRDIFDLRVFEIPRENVGSGVIYNTKGYIVTNYHVVKGARKLTVKLHDRRIYGAKVVGVDPATDIALIKIKNPPDNLQPAIFGDSDKVKVGDFVLAIGSPFGLESTISFGIVSAHGRKRGIIGFGYENFIQTDAAINPGNSGGALVNLNCEVIGINTAIATKTGQYSGVGFAIPSNLVKWVVERLIKGKEVVRGYLGVGISDIDLRLFNALVEEGIVSAGTTFQEFLDRCGLKEPKGAFVVKVERRTPAARAGLTFGDIIIEYDSKQVKDSNDLRFLIAQTSPGTRVKIGFLRDGKKRQSWVKIGKRPRIIR
jgi:serine protease Do